MTDHSNFDSTSEVGNMAQMGEHIWFDNYGNIDKVKKNVCGSVKKKGIIVKYCWFTEKKRTVVIAYHRDYKTGSTLYGASILKNSKNGGLYSTKTYHRYIATERLYWYPVYVTTDINIHQSEVEAQIREYIDLYGTSCRVFDYWDDNAYNVWEKGEFYKIKNPFEKRTNDVVSIRNETLKLLPYDAEYFWTKNNNRMTVCVYSNRGNNLINYAASIFKSDSNKSSLTKSEKLMHVKTAISRYLKKPVSVSIEANNKKVNIELIPNNLGQNLDLEKWSLTKSILLVKKIIDVDINIL